MVKQLVTICQYIYIYIYIYNNNYIYIYIYIIIYIYLNFSLHELLKDEHNGLAFDSHQQLASQLQVLKYL